MTQDFKRVLSLLYQEFGDQGTAWVREQLSYRPNTAGEEPSSDSLGADPAIDDDTYHEDGEAFSADIRASVQGLSTNAIQSPREVVDVVLGLVMMAGEVRKFEEAQVTKRVGIAAERDIAIANVKAQQELLKNYLNKSFDERAENFKSLFVVVDDALESDNMTALAMGLESVVKLAVSSPFKDLHTIQETAAALADPDHEWDF